jgi:hypothetical protein
MKRNVSTNFGGAAESVRTGYPDNVSFHVLCVTKEGRRFSAWFKFGQPGRQNPGSTRGTKKTEMGKIWFVVMPEFKRGFVRQEV